MTAAQADDGPDDAKSRDLQSDARLCRVAEVADAHFGLSVEEFAAKMEVVIQGIKESEAEYRRRTEELRLRPAETHRRISLIQHHDAIIALMGAAKGARYTKDQQ